MPLATFRHSTTSSLSPDDTWDALQNPEVWAGIGLISKVWDPRQEEDGRLISFDFRTEAAGKTWDGVARVVTARPGEAMDLALTTQEIRARIGVEMIQASGTTSMSVRLEVEPAGMLATIFWGVVREAISKGFRAEVDALAGGLSAGGTSA